MIITILGYLFLWLIGAFLAGWLGSELQGGAAYGIIPLGLIILWTVGFVLYLFFPIKVIFA